MLVIGAKLLINSDSGNFDLREYCILLSISHRATEPQRKEEGNREDEARNTSEPSLPFPPCFCPSVSLWLCG
jgi:hypothetical protein